MPDPKTLALHVDSADASAAFEKLIAYYQESAENQKFSALIAGFTGTGKTFSLQTAPPPVYVDCFDPGGLRGMKDAVAKKIIIPDTRWANYRRSMDPLKQNRTCWQFWAKTLDERINSGFFDHVGTYVIDSATTWLDAGMKHLSETLPLSEKVPRPTDDRRFMPSQRDYLMLIGKAVDAIKMIQTLPCNFILTAHLGKIYADDGSYSVEFLIPGNKIKVSLLALFDEIYQAMVKPTKDGNEYYFRMTNGDLEKGVDLRTRIGAKVFSAIEPQDFGALVKKAGLELPDRRILS